jgi:4-hydroxy-3-methylbut-2-enyl diphosphate reductase
MRVRRAAKYGFCSGVRVADVKVRRFVAGGGRGSILGQVVHNERVVEDMERLGMRTVNSIADVESGTLVFSAHGVPPSFHEEAENHGLQVLDTTCKFVYDIHRESREALANGAHLVFIGHPEHREVIGYTHDLDPADYHVVSTEADIGSTDWSVFESIKIFFQTTLNANDFEHLVDAIEEQNAATSRADTICYATKENQDAARELAEDPEVDLVIVVGGAESANTRHLWEITNRRKRSHLIQDSRDLEQEWFEGVATVGLTAGASTPDSLVDEVEKAILALVEAQNPGRSQLQMR